ncbi:hypothetical protein M758_4G106200, partial [Ceratodon purpureus]
MYQHLLMCIALHIDALAAIDAAKASPELRVLDDFSNFAYTWVGRSSLRQTQLNQLMVEFAIDPLVVLHIYGVRWLSRGQVMQRVLDCMPSFLELFREEEEMWYRKLTSFQFQFLLRLLVDILTELNKLNKLFQSDHVDITQIGGHLNICINILSRHFLAARGAAFGRGSKALWPFLETCATSMEMEYPVADGGMRTYPMHLESVTGRAGTIEECRLIGAEYVQRVVDALNNRFPDLGIFNACKLFSPNLYPAD